MNTPARPIVHDKPADMVLSRQDDGRIFADGRDTGLVLRQVTAKERAHSLGKWCLERPDGGDFTEEQRAVLLQMSR